MAGLFLLSGLFSIVVLLVPLALVLGLIVVFALRGEQDEGNGRAATLYLALASFVGFLTLLFAATAASAAIADLVADNPPDGGRFSYEDESGLMYGDDEMMGADGGYSSFDMPGDQSSDDAAWTTLIQAIIAAVAAAGVLRFHWPRLDAVGTRAVPGSGSARMRQSYCYVVCFLVVVTLLVSVSVAVFNVVQVAAPGTTGAGNRGDAVESFVPVAVLAIGAALLFRLHWARVELPAFLRTEPEGSAEA